MYLLGYSINNLSLMALTIASGFVVDDAIVMIENIARYLEEGVPPLEAALRGSQQVGFTIVSLTVSLIAVLIPLLFMGEVVGRLFREFAITLAVTILISAFVSLTLVPMMCAKLLHRRDEAHETRFAHMSRRFFEGLTARYDSALVWVLDRQALILLIAVATVAVTGLLYVAVPKGFFPVQDTGIIQGISEMPQSVSFAAMSQRQEALAAAILGDPDVVSLTSFIGVDGTNTTLNSGRFLINLKPHDTRSEHGAGGDPAPRPRDGEPARHPALSAAGAGPHHRYHGEPGAIPVHFGEPRSGAPSDLDRQAGGPAAAGAEAGRCRQRQPGERALGLHRGRPRHRRAASASRRRPSTTLYDAFGQRIVSTIFTQSNQYRVILEADPALQNSLKSLDAIYLPSATAAGGQVPLSALAKVREETAPLQINHQSQFPAPISPSTSPPASRWAPASSRVQAAEAEIGLPASIFTTFQGAALSFQAALGNELLLILAAIVTVYIVLGVLYESFVHPVTILSTLPSAGIGALLALLITGHELDIIAIIGIVLLIGIVKKNAIMMIDFALDAERNEGMAPRDAIHQACLLRLRPILMTTMAALLGALPLMVGGGGARSCASPWASPSSAV
jgi:Cation/multidrug efflux pump